MGFNSVPPGMPPSPGPPQVYGTSGTAGMVPPGAPGVSVIGNMGPPASSMGPPPPSPNHISNQPPPTSSAVPHLHTPAATPPLNHEGSPMPPPSTTPNSHPASVPTPTSHNSADLAVETSNDSGITTTASGAEKLSRYRPMVPRNSQAEKNASRGRKTYAVALRTRDGSNSTLTSRDCITCICDRPRCIRPSSSVDGTLAHGQRLLFVVASSSFRASDCNRTCVSSVCAQVRQL